MAEIVRLAELLALPVMDSERFDRLNFPTTHALYGTGPAPKDADALLILEGIVPYLPPLGAPRPGAKVVWVEPDPVLSNYKSMEHQADLWLAVTAGAAARAIYEAATAILSKSDMSRIAERRERLEAAKRGMVAENERLGQEAGRRQTHAPALGRVPTGKDP